MVQAVLTDGLCSGRQACQILRLARATLWYRAGQRSDRQQQMVARLQALSAAHPRYGYRRIAALLRQEGWVAGKRQVQRLRRLEGLRVPPTKRKYARRGRSTGLPTKATHRGHVWTWDFIADATVRGGALRMLTVLDEHTRECHVLRADRALKSTDVIAPWWAKPSSSTARLSLSARTTARSSLPMNSKRGWLGRESRQSTSSRPVPGRTGSSNPSTAAFVMNVSTANNCGPSRRPGSSLRTSASTTIHADPIVGLVIAVP